jgi:putative transposase
MDDQILSLHTKGMRTRDIVAAFDEMYGAEISAGRVSQVTNTVMEHVVEWQCRPLDAVYPIAYMDCIVFKNRQDKQVINKAIYLALGINIEVHKELLDIWMSENEGAKFCLLVWKDYKEVTTDLKRIYRSVTEERAVLELDLFAEKWDEK